MSEQAFEEWLNNVASGEARMSQRNLKWVDANGGREKLVSAAQLRGVHLVELTDDTGKQLIAASKHPFVTLC